MAHFSAAGITGSSLIKGALVLLALVFLAYIPALKGGYIWDDDPHVLAITNRGELAGRWRIWTSPGATPQYYSLVHTTFWIEYHLWGPNPIGFHLVNVMLHAVSAVVLWFLLRRLSLRWCWLAAAVFALHPVRVPGNGGPPFCLCDDQDCWDLDARALQEHPHALGALGCSPGVTAAGCCRRVRGFRVRSLRGLGSSRRWGVEAGLYSRGPVSSVVALRATVDLFFGIAP